MANPFELAAGTPWLITPEGLDQVLAIAARQDLDLDAVSRAHAEYENSPVAVAMRAGERLPGTARVSVRDGVAIVPVQGPIFRYANMITMLSGATSTQLLASDFQRAVDSPDVRAIMLVFDSPGGVAAGIADLASEIRAARTAKPVVAFGDGMIASAAYWLGAGAETVVLSQTALAGSIGAAMVGADTSFQDAQRGIRPIRIVSRLSPHKLLGPETREGGDERQAIVDALAEKFVLAIAANRGVTAAHVLEHFGRGAIVPNAEDAVRVGMADRIGTFESLLRELAAGGSTRSITFAAAAAAPMRGLPMSDATTGAAPMTAAALVTAYPDAVAQIRAAAIAEAAPQIQADIRQRETAASESERTRISQIMRRTLPGHAAIRDRAIETGMSFTDFLEAQTAAEQERGANRLAGLRTDERTQPRLDADPASGERGPTAEAPATDTDLPLETRAKVDWDRNKALRAEFGDQFQTYLSYRQAEETGRVRRYVKE